MPTIGPTLSRSRPRWRNRDSSPGCTPKLRTPLLPACSLSAADAGRQLGEWHQLLGELPASRLSPTQLEVRLAGRPAVVAPVVQLAQREKVCCPFFDFSLHVEADAVVLRLSVPADATLVLHELAPDLRLSFGPLRASCARRR
jgi:hypothetical protein